jgi:hypothetical protein
MSSIVLSGDTSGQVSLTVPAVAGSNTVTIPAGTGTAAVQGVSTNIVSGTAVASTSGTSIDFTSIPSWVKRITVMCNGISLSGTSNIRFQLGSGSVETTGYANANVNLQQSGTVTVQNITAGFDINTGVAAEIVSGHLMFTNVSGNIWVASGLFVSTTGTTVVFNTAGNKTLAGVLDRVRITSVNGTDTFDAGSVNILYE